jgi:hypothetical protein
MTATDVQQKLALALKSNGKPYWNTLKDFIQGNISRCEFEEIIRQYITTPHLGMFFRVDSICYRSL